MTPPDGSASPLLGTAEGWRAPPVPPAAGITHPRRRRRRRAIPCAVLGGALLGLAVIGGAGFLGWRARDLALAQTGRELRNLSILLADQTERTLDVVEMQQDTLAQRLQADGVATAEELRAWASPHTAPERLRRLAAGLPQLATLALVDDRGEVVGISQGASPPRQVMDRDAFEAVRNGAERFLGRPVRSSPSDPWTIVVARRVSGPGGEFLGAILGLIEIAHFERLYGSLQLDPSGSIALFRNDGVLLARHPPLEHAIGRDFGDTEGFRQAQASPEGRMVIVRSTVDDARRLVVARSLADRPLRVHVATTINTVLAPWRRAAMQLAGGTVLLLGLIAASVAAAVRRARAVAEAAAERQRRARDLAAQHALFRDAVEGMGQGIWMFDLDGRLALANRRCAEIIGVPEGALRQGIRFAELRAAARELPDGGSRELLERLARQAETRAPGSFVQALGDGREVSVTHQPLADGGWIATFEDVTERRAAEARIAHLARHDAITGLPNRAELQARLEEVLRDALRNAGRVAVLHIGLDRFREVNDTLGYPAGDALLRAAAGRIASRIRAQRAKGDFLARLGGDEFVVVTTPVFELGADAAAEAAGLARRLITALSEPFELDGQRVVVGASIGVALHPLDGQEAEDLLRNASLALDQAKREGGGRHHFFDAETDRQGRAQRLLELDLRRSLDMPQAPEFEVHYQPVVDIATLRVRGFEALLRWHHPVRGLVSPAVFVPIAERTGLVAELGGLVLRRACAEAAAWDEKLRIAVNLSPLQFRMPGLVETVASALIETGLEPNRLELEITEGVLLQRTESTLAILHRLRALGVRIALDDFGTGYSSLAYLRAFPFDKVKVDRSFVQDLATRAEDVAIVRAVVTLCRQLGMAVTAEGIETEAQRRILASEGCAEGQGYLFGKPAPAAEIGAILRRLGVERPDRAQLAVESAPGLP